MKKFFFLHRTNSDSSRVDINSLCHKMFVLQDFFFAQSKCKIDVECMIQKKRKRSLFSGLSPKLPAMFC